jgi:hypothetical protein
VDQIGCSNVNQPTEVQLATMSQGSGMLRTGINCMGRRETIMSITQDQGSDLAKLAQALKLVDSGIGSTKAPHCHFPDGGSSIRIDSKARPADLER